MALSIKVLLVVLILLIVAAVSGYVIGVGQQAPSQVKSTVTSTSTVTQTVLTHQGLYELSFNQTAECPNLGFVSPWSVTLSDGASVTEPPNANFSDSYSVSLKNPSAIVFYVPSGVYSFQIKPNLLGPPNGTVTVSGQNAVVRVGQVILSCGSTTAHQG